MCALLATHRIPFRYAPKGAPDVAFTAELDGKDGLALNESNPGFADSKPAGIDGYVEYDNPTPTANGNTLPTYFQQQLRLGYYTAVTLSDYNMGRVLDLVDELEIYNDTVVILTGDHGWQLGEHAEWGKHTNWELAVQVPLIIRAPWTGSAGMHTQTFIELLDLYRTVSALAGIPEPETGVGGNDLSAVLSNPTAVLKNVTYAQYSRCPGDRYWPKVEPNHPAYFMNNCEGVPATNISFMGYTVRSSEFRYTEWRKWLPTCVADWTDLGRVGVELYSHEGQPGFPLDFDAWENENIASSPDVAKVIAEHARMLSSKFATGANLGCPPPQNSSNAAASMEF